MELKGKKIAFLGDSITEGTGTSGIEHVYWRLVADATGALCYGYGVGGTRIAPQRVPTAVKLRWDRYFGSRVEGMIPDADIVVIFGGTNDFGHGDAAFGSLTDRTNDTFCGAYHLLLQSLMARYPNARLMVMTPLHRVSEDETDYNEFGVRRVGPLSKYAEAIRQIARYYGVPVVDLFRDCPIQPRAPGQREKYMPDGVHANDAGHILIAGCVLDALSRL